MPTPVSKITINCPMGTTAPDFAKPKEKASLLARVKKKASALIDSNDASDNTVQFKVAEGTNVEQAQFTTWLHSLYQEGIDITQVTATSSTRENTNIDHFNKAKESVLLEIKHTKPKQDDKISPELAPKLEQSTDEIIQRRLTELQARTLELKTAILKRTNPAQMDNMNELLDGPSFMFENVYGVQANFDAFDDETIDQVRDAIQNKLPQFLEKYSNEFTDFFKKFDQRTRKIAQQYLNHIKSELTSEAGEISQRLADHEKMKANPVLFLQANIKKLKEEIAHLDEEEEEEELSRPETTSNTHRDLSAEREEARKSWYKADIERATASEILQPIQAIKDREKSVFDAVTIEINAAKEKAYEASNNIAIAKKTLATATDTKARAEETIIDADKKIKNAEGELEQAEIKIAAATETTRIAKEKIQDAEGKLNAAASQIDEANKAIHVIRETIQATTSELETAKTTITRSTEEMNEANGLETAQDQLRVAAGEIVSANTQKGQNDKIIQTAEKWWAKFSDFFTIDKTNTYKHAAKNAEDQNNALESTITNQTAIVKMAQSTIEKQQELINTINLQETIVKTAEKNITALNEKEKKAEEIIASQEEIATAAKQTIHDQKPILETAGLTIEAQNDIKSTAEKTIIEQKEIKQNNQTIIDEKNKSMSEASTIIEQQERSLAKAQATITTKTAEAATAQKQIETLIPQEEAALATLHEKEELELNTARKMLSMMGIPDYLDKEDITPIKQMVREQIEHPAPSISEIMRRKEMDKAAMKQPAAETTREERIPNTGVEQPIETTAQDKTQPPDAKRNWIENPDGSMRPPEPPVKQKNSESKVNPTLAGTGNERPNPPAPARSTSSIKEAPSGNRADFLAAISNGATLKKTSPQSEAGKKNSSPPPMFANAGYLLDKAAISKLKATNIDTVSIYIGTIEEAQNKFDNPTPGKIYAVWDENTGVLTDLKYDDNKKEWDKTNILTKDDEFAVDALITHIEENSEKIKDHVLNTNIESVNEILGDKRYTTSHTSR